MVYVDKNLECKDCGKTFVFSANEQEFYAEKGFKNEPLRCPECRSARKQNVRNNRRDNNSFRAPRKMYRATCSACGASTEVPFKPSGEKPVYCRDCFQRR
ncbi:zinc-ribbon domain containing protein [Microaerobacter geothermalis]|uniref:zinc-ribbon domain containing protein n=1 Tax=Microaerobacter geothermalis TaxID=674972 RepID=UPI001F2FA702|nr:zinc-ribbon domain containing protein [Microaerobacter geothermalis]MCF6094865.1 zinc-ribbon domain containing protein [Microaerobacter geothermalis]